MIRNRREVMKRFVLIVGLFEVLAGVVVGATGHTFQSEGWLGGLLFIVLVAGPLLLVVLALSSGGPRVQRVMGWISAILVIYWILVVIGNWRGYSGAQVVLSLTAIIPAVVAFFVGAVLLLMPESDDTDSSAPG